MHVSQRCKNGNVGVVGRYEKNGRENNRSRSTWRRKKKGRKRNETMVSWFESNTVINY